MSEGKPRKTAQKDVKTPKNSPKSSRKGSNVPFLGDDGGSGRGFSKDDSFGNTLEVFNQNGTVLGNYTGYGSDIRDSWRLFYSQREPVGVWWVTNVAYDIFDNWFCVKDISKPDSMDLDKSVQSAMIKLKARQVLPRETIFERRYGTALLLLSYLEPGMSWEKPLFEPKMGEEWQKLANSKLIQITPYPKTVIVDINLDDDPHSYRYGLPELYYINTSNIDQAQPLPPGLREGVTAVHWTRVIHDAPRLDEHPYYGESAIDPIFDDLVGGRNARWGMYQGYYRNGQGFPVFHTKGSKKENEDWITAGGVNEIMNARGYFVCGPDEDMDFRGAQAAALNPTSYFDAYFSFISAATSVTADVIKGISAGRLAGNEAGERKYFKVISLLQHQKELMLRELIDRLIQTGQVEFDGEYFIDWTDPFEVNPQDKASIDYLQTRTAVLELQYMTIDEVRAKLGMEPLPNGAGEMLLPQPGQFANPSVGGAKNQEKPAETRTPEQPTENPAEQGQSVSGEEETLFDKVKKDAE